MWTFAGNAKDMVCVAGLQFVRPNGKNMVDDGTGCTSMHLRKQGTIFHADSRLQRCGDRMFSFWMCLEAWMYYICDVQETTLPPWQKELPYACAEVLQWVCPLAICLVSCGAGFHSVVDVVSP